MFRTIACAWIGIVATQASAPAAFFVTFEAPGVNASLIPGVITETFDSFTPNTNYSNLSTAIGSYTSPSLRIVNGNMFGGANDTPYVEIGQQSGASEMTVAIGQSARYFGFFWTAGDLNNSIEFYDNNTLVFAYNLQDVLTSGLLSAGHFGNPLSGANNTEPYVFLNFFAVGGSQFDQITFRNNGIGTGYESDNHTIRYDAVLTFSGTPLNSIPEAVATPLPASAWLGVLGGLALAGLRRRLNRSIAA